jgi:hypothetical protein
VTDRLTASQMMMAASTLIRVAVLICQFFMTILTRTPEQIIFSGTDKPWHSLVKTLYQGLSSCRCMCLTDCYASQASTQASHRGRADSYGNRFPLLLVVLPWS